MIIILSSSMIQAKLNQLANFMVRPRRRSYLQSDLGPTVVKSKYGVCTREDFQVQFQYGNTYGYNQTSNLKEESLPNKFYKIHCSIFLPIGALKVDYNKQASNQRICVLGLHGNTGSKMSTIGLLQPVLKYGLILAIFDFLGCGNSQGEHVTLGYSQKHQISAVLQQIYHRYGCHKFMLYGRSMGASSSLFYCDQIYPLYVKAKQSRIKQYYQQVIKQYKNSEAALMDVVAKLNTGYFGYEVVGLIMDSPYYDAKQMILDIVSQRLCFIPRFLTNYVLQTINQRVKEKLNYMNLHKCKTQAMSESELKQNTEKSQFSLLHDTKIQKQSFLPFPVFMIYGLNDDVIAKAHTFQLFRRISSPRKKLNALQNKGHGDHRDDQLKMEALQWVLNLQYRRVSQRVQRDCRLLGLTINQYIKYSYKFEYNNYVKQSQIPMSKGSYKQREKSTEMGSQRNGSIASIKAMMYPFFGSGTSLQSTQQKKCRKGSQNVIPSCTNLEQVCENGQSIIICQKFHQKGKKSLQNKMAMRKIQQVVGELESEQQNKLLQMSRVSPFRLLRMQMGINVISKQKQCPVTKLSMSKIKNN